MNGLRGMPCSTSSWIRELNAVPDGSRPQRFALQAERRRQREDLRNGLYREALRRIAEQVLPSVDRIETDAETIGIDARQSRNVIGRFALARKGLYLAIYIFEYALIVHIWYTVYGSAAATRTT